MRRLLALPVRLALLLAGLIFAFSLVVAATVLAVVGLLVSLWARLTGRPAPGFAGPVETRARFAQALRRAHTGTRWTRSADGRPRPAADGGVTDVQPRPAAALGDGSRTPPFDRY